VASGIVLIEDEWQMIINALAAVSRSGGGSPEYTLQRRLMDYLKIQDDSMRVIHYQMVAYQEVGRDLEELKQKREIEK